MSAGDGTGDGAAGRGTAAQREDAAADRAHALHAPRAPMTAPVGDLKDPMDVSGLVVVVTGGSNGIGFGVAEAFAQRGADVALLDIEVESGRSAAERLRQGGGRHVFVECDISDREAVRRAVDTVIEAFGHIDVLVNNAGIAAVKPFLDMAPDLPEYHRVIDVNLHGTVHMTHAVGNAMRAAARGGLIINISSVGAARCSGSREMPMIGYVASKAAINHLTTSWAIELAEYDIRVNCIMPGPTHSRLDEQLTPEMRERNARGTLDRRYGEPHENVALCVFMASAEGAHLNGVIMPHDGGFLCIN
jgi:NAD(P)-dependent dehydrogenase (short-subunit alcohol dehydrogenase family)